MRKPRNNKLALTLVALLCMVGCGKNPVRHTHGNITGTVLANRGQTHQIIENAEVILAKRDGSFCDTTFSTRANNLNFNNYYFENVPVGPYNISASYKGPQTGDSLYTGEREFYLEATEHGVPTSGPNIIMTPSE